MEPKRGGPLGEGEPLTCSMVTGGTCTVSDAIEAPPVPPGPPLTPVEESKLVLRLLLGGVLLATAVATPEIILSIVEEEEEEEEETLYSKLSEIVIKTQDSNEVYNFFLKKMNELINN